MNYKIQPTPAVALGAYEITPLEAAGAYTIFANHGEYVQPNFISMVRSSQGSVVYQDKPERRQAIDQRLAYVMTNLMQEVLATGTAMGVRERYNINFPAAGKTGTSHDGWFAGYTTDLLCIVWVGFDDNRELNLEGAHSAAPIWAEFMKRAVQYRDYRDPKPFEVPGGIVSVIIDPDTGMPATSNCPRKRPEVYIAGTEPMGVCPLHGGRQVTNIAGWDTSTGSQAKAAASGEDASTADPPGSGAGASPAQGAAGAPRGAQGTRRAPAQKTLAPAQPPKPPEKKSIWRRLIGVFK
jgi:penicillin-binding protein 1B